MDPPYSLAKADRGSFLSSLGSGEKKHFNSCSLSEHPYKPEVQQKQNTSTEQTHPRRRTTARCICTRLILLSTFMGPADPLLLGAQSPEGRPCSPPTGELRRASATRPGTQRSGRASSVQELPRCLPLRPWPSSSLHFISRKLCVLGHFTFTLKH